MLPRNSTRERDASALGGGGGDLQVAGRMKHDPAGLLARLRAAPAFVNFSWLVADKALRLVLGVFVGMWVARYLGPADFGVISYGLAAASLLVVVPGLGLDAIVRRQLVRVPEETEQLLGTTFRLRLVIGIVAYAALIGCAGVFEPNPAARLALAIGGLTLLQQSILTIDLWFQAHLLSKNTVIAHNVSFSLCSALRVLLILRGAELEAFLWVLGLETTITSVLLVVAYLRSGKTMSNWRWDASIARQLLRESWPLALATVATVIYVRVDQVMLRTISGTTETGIYAAAARIMEVLFSLPMMLAASLSPGLVQARTRSPEEYHALMQRFFRLAAASAWGATLVCALLAPWGVPLVFGPAYARSAAMLVVLSFSLPFIALGIARQEYWINEGRQRFQLVTISIGAALNVTLNLWAIPRWGGMGAAAVVVASHVIADLLTSWFWPSTRDVGRWQLRALTLFWRPSLALPRPSS